MKTNNRQLNVAQKMLKTIQNHGHSAFIVGGFVRDCVMYYDGNVSQLPQKAVFDIDIATSMPFEMVQTLFETLASITHFGMNKVMYDGYAFEVTTFRSDFGVGNHRYPQYMIPAQTLHVDLQRRDFTMNALAMNAQFFIIDYMNGKFHLSSQTLVAVGNPTYRFQEDALRMFRALRFMARYHLKPDNDLDAALYTMTSLVQHVSSDRIVLEMKKCNDALPLFLSDVKQYKFNKMCNIFETLEDIPVDVLLKIDSLEMFQFFQIYYAKDKNQAYEKLMISRKKYQKICRHIDQVRDFAANGQTPLWNYQLNQDTSVFKYLDAIFGENIFTLEENYHSQEIKSWNSIQFDTSLYEKIEASRRFSVINYVVKMVLENKVDNEKQAITELVYQYIA